MQTSSLDRLERLFRAASLLPTVERAGFLEAACGGDDVLRSELEALLQSSEEAERDGFLSDPALEGKLGALLSPDVDEPDTSIGRKLGPYVLARRLGHGGMGDVYLAVRERPFRQHVALKIIRPGMDSRDVLQRFEMERQILAALDHPNIARLLDGGVTEDGRPYFAMEYVDGESLTEFCDKRRLTVDARVRLFREACAAVHYAHQNLVLHRDLKPSNILVTPEGKVRLLDFGIAKLLNPHLSPVTMPLTRTEFRLMTPEYASPEQVRGEQLSTASDVYSLGVLLYELLTGRRPHEAGGRSTIELAQAVAEEEPERPSTSVTRSARKSTGHEITPATVARARSSSVDRLRRHLRGDLDNIVLMALRKEPSRRYVSAEQLSADLGRYLDGLPVEARPSTIVYRIRKFARRNRVGVSAAVAVVIALVAGLGVSLWQSAEAQRERSRADAARVEAEQALAQSEAVTGYLAGLFSAVDPYTTLGEERSARELLEQGVDQIGELESEPLVQARMFFVFSEVYRSIGQYDRAQRFMEQSLSLRRRHLPPGHADVAGSVYTLADIVRRRGDLAEAERLYREALAMRLELYGERHPTVAYNLNGLGLTLLSRDAFEEAEAVLRKALEIRRALHGDRSVEVATSLSSLGRLLRHTRRYDEAESVYQEALVTHLQLFGEGHPYHAELLNNLAVVHRERGDFEAAAPLFLQAVAAFRTLHGDEHPHTATVRQNYADLLRMEGRYAEAEPIFRETLATQQRVLGHDHADCARTLANLAALLLVTDRPEESERLYREALAIVRANFDDGHAQSQIVFAGLVDLYEAQGRGDEAARYRRLITAATADSV